MSTSDSPATPATPATPDTVLRIAIAASVTFALGILTAIGVQGAVLQRMIRAEPVLFAGELIAVIVGTVLPLVWSALRVATKRELVGRLVDLIGGVLVVAGIASLVVTGSISINQREVPRLDVAASKTTDGALHFVATANGASLRLDEALTMRISLTRDSSVAALPPSWLSSCWEKDEIGNAFDVTGFQTEEMVYWHSSGAATDGTATVSADIVVDPDKYTHACVVSWVTSRPKEPPTPEDRTARFVVDVSQLFDPTPTPSPSPTLGSAPPSGG